jgi:intein/homing endonuclease
MLSKEKARIIAHLIGDGAHYKTKHDYVMKYEVRDYELLDQFSDDILKVYGLAPSWEINHSGITGESIRFVRLRSKLAFEDLLRYATYFSKDWSIKSEILESDLEIKKEFLRALFDDEGSVKSKYEIVLYSINESGLLQVRAMLSEFGLTGKIRQGYGQKRNVFGLGIKDFKKFKEMIGFNLKRKQEKLNKFL